MPRKKKDSSRRKNPTKDSGHDGKGRKLVKMWNGDIPPDFGKFRSILVISPITTFSMANVRRTN